MTTADLLSELGANSDLVPLVQRVTRYPGPWVVVSSVAASEWGRRDPESWAKVCAWLAERGVTLVRI